MIYGKDDLNRYNNYIKLFVGLYIVRLKFMWMNEKFYMVNELICIFVKVKI